MARNQARKFLDEATSIREALRELADEDDGVVAAAADRSVQRQKVKRKKDLRRAEQGQAKMDAHKREDSLLPVSLKKSTSAAAEAKRRDMAQYFMAGSKADAEGERGFSTKESSYGKDRLQRIEEMVLEMDPDDEGGEWRQPGGLPQPSSRFQGRWCGAGADAGLLPPRSGAVSGGAALRTAISGLGG